MNAIVLLEKNDPEAGRWYSRDVAALSDDVGPTVVGFRNPHLSYALTWYTMAALLLAGTIYVVIRQIRDFPTFDTQ